MTFDGSVSQFHWGADFSAQQGIYSYLGTKEREGDVHSSSYHP